MSEDGAGVHTRPIKCEYTVKHYCFIDIDFLHAPHRIFLIFLLQVKQFVLNGGRPAVSGDIPDGLKQLMEDCWSEPDERPTFADITRRLENTFRSLPQDTPGESPQ